MRCELSSTATPRALSERHDVAHVGPSERVERAGGLVEHDEVGSGHQRHRQAEPLLHALGEAAHAVARAVGQTHERERVLPLVGRDVGTGEADVQAQHLGRREPGLVAEQLGR